MNLPTGSVIHRNPTFSLAGGYVNTDGSFSITIECTGNYGVYGNSLYLQFGMMYNDGSYEEMGKIHGSSSMYSPGAQYSISGRLSQYGGKSSGNIYMYCNSQDVGVADCTIGAGSYPGIVIVSGITFYRAPSGVWARVNSSTHNSFNVTVGWTQGTNGATAYATDVASAGRDVSIGTNPGGSTGNTKADAIPNKEYGIYAWVHDGTSQVFGLSNYKYWTHPYLENPTLSLVSGNEHDQIKVVANNNYKSNYDKYAFKLDDGSWTDWQDSNEYIFSRSNYPTILGMTNHTIYTKVKNTSSNFESVNQPSASITTWYDPIYDLSVLLINRWFWYLEINSQVDYQGGYENITKYEFDIGSQGYTDKGTNNTYNRGSIDPKASNKLNYNTDYLCKVRVTDNHGRTKEASATYRTLDERPLYVNGVLREVKIIKSDGSIEYVTPNLLTVVKSDGTTVNMNKIINNDNRTSYQ